MRRCLLVLPILMLPREALAQAHDPAAIDPPPPPPPLAPAELVSADEGEAETADGFKGFAIESADGNWKLRLQGHLQVRFTYSHFEHDSDELAFSIPRARPIFDGHLATPDLVYRLQFDFSQGKIPTLKDGYLEYRFHDYARVRAGQMKKPFTRAFINSGTRMQFVDRAITHDFFGATRDIGLMVHDDFDESPVFEYALGVFNGTTDRTVFVAPPADGFRLSGDNVPARLHPVLVGRVGYNYGGIDGYTESDLEGGGPRFAIGASGQMHFDVDDDDQSGISADVDYIFKAHGFSTSGAVYLAWASDSGLGSQRFSAVGMHVQAGYAIAKLVQPAVRYAVILPDGPDNDRHEILGVVGFYPFGYTFNVQVDGGALIDNASDATDARVRAQAQVSF